MLGQSIRQSVIGLGLFAIVTAGVIAFTQVNTQQRIVVNEQAAKAKALYEILPPESHDNNLLEDSLPVDDPALVADNGPAEAYVARQNGEAIAVILPVVAPDGYTGKIHSIVGIRADGTIAGVRVLAHKETPGLGDKVEIKKSDWALQFTDKSLTDPGRKGWAVKKDRGVFDQLTGATITPRAIVKSIHRALIYFKANREQLLAPRPEPQTDTASPSPQANEEG